MIDKCEKLCKYYGDDGGCDFFTQGSGIPKDMPCYYERETATWENVLCNSSMMKCSKCNGTWWNKEFKTMFKYCPECGRRIIKKDGETNAR